MVQPLWKTLWKFLSKLKIELLYDPVILPPGIYPDKTIIQKDTCTSMFTEVLFAIVKTWKQSKCPPTDEQIEKTQCIYTVEYYTHKVHSQWNTTVIEKNKIMPFAATWVDLEIITLSK